MKNRTRDCTYTVGANALQGKVEEMAGAGWTLSGLVMVNITKHLERGVPPLYQLQFKKMEMAQRRPRITGLQRRMRQVREAVRQQGVTL